MRLKSLITIALLVFVAASVVYLILNDFPVRVDNSEENGETIALAVTAPSSGSPDRIEQVQHRIIAYYFHGTARCATCRAIEQYTHEALVTGFPTELESGTLEWRPINVEEPQNQHFIDEYQLTMRSVILADMAGENQTRWKNLERIWDFVVDEDAFISYIQEETRAYLEGN